MNKYQFRKNYFFSGKIVFKTQETAWINTTQPVLVPISIHSSFHQGIIGPVKMNAYLSLLKENIQGPITLLMTEKAHWKVNSLNFETETQALEQMLKDARALEAQFAHCFADCQVKYWHEYINQDPYYPAFHKQVIDLYQNDSTFHNLILQDTDLAYSPQFGEKKLYKERAIEDLLEQCSALLVLKQKGYRFQFYPGKQYQSVNYLNNLNPSLTFIYVFLATEKKQF